MSVITASNPGVAPPRQFPYRRPRLRTLATVVVLCGAGVTMLHAAPGATWQTALAAACLIGAAVALAGLLADTFTRPRLGFDGAAIVLPVGALGTPLRIEPADVERIDSFQSGRHALVRLHTRAGRFSVSSLRLPDDGMRALYAWIDRHVSR